jgi:protein tyrosine/serine phosphatase
MKVLVTSLRFSVLTVCGIMTLFACNSKILEDQAEIIHQQKIQIAEQEKIKETLEAKNRLEKQKQRDCNRAFREYFDKAQLATNREQTISLYREDWPSARTTMSRIMSWAELSLQPAGAPKQRNLSRRL